MSAHGLYGPRPGSDPEKTPTHPHERPAPVVVRSGTLPKQPPPLPPARGLPRAPTPLGGTLAQLGRLPPPAGPLSHGNDTPEDRVRMALMSRVLRTCDALPIEDLRLIAAFALRLRPGVGE